MVEGNGKRMRILVVMANYPFPPRTGSANVAYNAMKHLSQRHHVELICSRPMGEVVNPAEFVERVDLVPQEKISRIAKWARYFLYMLIGEPPSVSAYASRSMAKKVRSEIQRVGYDAILLFEMSAIQYCPSSSFNKLVVNIEDPQSIRLCRSAALPIWPLWQRLKLFAVGKLTASYENRIIHRIARVLLLSESDICDLRKNKEYQNIVHVPYGVEQRSAAEIASYESRERVVIFSGNMFHPPNVDGGLFLLKDIFPLILCECPSAVLWIVGSNPDRRICEAAAKYGKQVVITGKVDDVADYIRQATVSICPVRLNIGVQTKILEALSWGTPVVTTSAGNSGIGGVTGTHLWVEDDAYMIARKVCDLLQGRDWKKMSAEGRKLVLERFTWEGSVAQLEQHLKAVVAAD